MAETSRASLGFVTSYGAARRGGYTGTYEEWCELMATVADHLEENRTIHQDVQGAKSATEPAEGEAEGAALTAESWAKGTRGGTAVPDTDPAYHDNAKYYADEAEYQKGLAVQASQVAAQMAGQAEGHSTDAEAWAKGTRGGEDVESGDDAYQNNAKYFSEQSSGSATEAAGSAETAEGWATGGSGGTAGSQNNAKYYSQQAAASAQTAAAMGTNFAPEFSSSTSYSAGDYVLYQGTLYRFTADHAAGAWVGTDAAAEKIAPVVSDLKESLNDCRDVIQIPSKRVRSGNLALGKMNSGSQASGVTIVNALDTVARVTGTVDVSSGNMVVHFTQNIPLTNGHKYTIYVDTSMNTEMPSYGSIFLNGVYDGGTANKSIGQNQLYIVTPNRDTNMTIRYYMAASATVGSVTFADTVFVLYVVEGNDYTLKDFDRLKAIEADVSETENDIVATKEIVDDVTIEGTAGWELDTENNLITTLQDGYYKLKNGVPTVFYVEGFSHMKINVTAGTKYQIDKTHHTYTIAEANSLGVFVNDSGQLVALIADAAGGLPDSEPYDVIAPAGATKMYLTVDYPYTTPLSDIATTVYKYNEVAGYALNSARLSTQPVYYSDISASKKIKIIAGVIRNSGNGWEFLDDTGHNPLNLTTISVDENGYIVVDYGFTAKKVLSLVVAPDETYAGQYTCGASVGFDKATIRLFSLPKAIGGMVKYTNGAWAYANTSDFTGATFDSNGSLTLTHEDLTGYPLSDIYSVSADSNGGNAQIVSAGNTSIIIRLVDASGNVITSPINNTSLFITRHLNKRLMNANNVVNSYGNFWIYGVMEVD